MNRLPERLSRRRVLALGGGAAVSSVACGTAVEPARPAPDDSGPRSRFPVRTGLDQLVESGFAVFAGERVGVISNPTGVDGKYSHLVDLMHAHVRDTGGLTLGGVFGPEHGFRGSAQAGGSEGTGLDARTGLTVYDAYNASQTTWETLYGRADVRTVVFDIQDVGSRFYTYIWTLYDSMVAAARRGLRYVVLDRPNPTGGKAYGPMMTTRFTTAVGKKEIVQQHGMTVGELARFFNGEFLPTDAGRPVELEVIECRGWGPDMLGGETDAPWVMPSPNMPTQDTALLYPGTGMFEGVTSLSEGRGTTRPFELIGGPGFDYRWSDRLNAANLPGVSFRESYFTPTFNKFANTLCAGVEVKVTQARAFDPIRTAVAMLVEARKYPAFAWRTDSWDSARPYWIDKLSGSERLRTLIDAGASTDDIIGAWQEELAAFDTRRRPYLLYSR